MRKVVQQEYGVGMNFLIVSHRQSLLNILVKLFINFFSHHQTICWLLY